MDSVAKLPTDDRRALFEEAMARGGYASSVVTEKDFWVCWTLKRLFALQGIPRLLFKGGTSLSKCFGIIHRFSEDIDLGLERADLALTRAERPVPSASRNRNQRAVKALSERVTTFVREEFLPVLQRDFESVLEQPFELRFADEGRGADLLFEYPCALESAPYGAYVAPVVKLEIGARSDHHPTREVQITPFAAEAIPEAFAQPSCVVRAQAPERTLLEKALILHTANSKQSLAPRSSRHAYDLTLMHASGMASLVTRELYEEVAAHKLAFADDRPASLAPEEGIRLVPEGDVLRALEADYRDMAEMLFTSPKPPTLAEVLEALSELESEIDRLGQ